MSSWLSARPLPPLAECGLNESSNNTACSAYTQILMAEKVSLDDVSRMNVRVIGFLLIMLHEFRDYIGDEALSCVAREVVSNSSVEAVTGLGEHYRFKLLRAFRHPKEKLPTPSEHPSRPSFDSVTDMIRDKMQEPGKDHRTAKNHALVRDGFRCQLTDFLDLASVRSSSQLSHLAIASGEVTTTQCCHILSESTLQNIHLSSSDTTTKRHYASGVLAILDAFGLSRIASTFMATNGIHHLSNILTLRTELHGMFDQLELWLEPTGDMNANEYKICSTSVIILKSFNIENKTVSFRVHTDIEGHYLPLPSQELLTLHACCAKVAHMSGAAEYMDRCDQDAESLLALAEDGSSAPLLIERINYIFH